MNTTRAGTLLLTLGVLVGVAASIGLIIGFEPARLPAALVNIAAYKLSFLAAGGLLAAGAILNRYSRRERLKDPLTPTVAREPAALGEEQTEMDHPFFTTRRRDRAASAGGDPTESPPRGRSTRA